MFKYDPLLELPRWLSGKESAYCCRRHRFNPWVGKIPWRRKWQPTPVSLHGKCHGQRSLVEYSPWGHKRVGYNLVTKQQQQQKQKQEYQNVNSVKVIVSVCVCFLSVIVFNNPVHFVSLILYTCRSL